MAEVQVKRSQTAPPGMSPMPNSNGNSYRRSPRDPNRHYVLVQKDCRVGDGDYISPLYELLDKMSHTTPGEMMYRLDSEDVRETGNSAMILISCSNDDYNMVQKLNAAEAESRGSAVKSSADGTMEETFSNSRTSISA